jgi:hypothetical protein
MGRSEKERLTCEDCDSIDIRRWHREGWRQEGQFVSWVEPSIDLGVFWDGDAVVSIYPYRGLGAPQAPA